MTQRITVKRTPPANLNPKDEALFSESMEATFQRLNPVSLKNVWILEDTVFDPSKFAFNSYRTHITKLGPVQFAKRIAYCLLKTWRIIPKAIWVTDEWSANYFHWMTDCLPRIWEGIEMAPNSPVLLPQSFEKLRYVTDSLKLAGLEVIFFGKNENLKIAELTLTARTATFPNFLEPLARKTSERLSINPTQTPWKKVYISRKLAPKRKAHNEEQVESFLKENGFEIVYAEKLSLLEQIELMSVTSLLVCLHGAALTNMLFLPKTSTVLELRNAGDAINQCYFNLASSLGLPYFYTLNAGDSQDTIMTDFTIDMEALSSALSEIETT
ncbi:MAG: glycosyltransferase family 61 protein [Algoriphagus sp.]|nr:glycosyltransferase family 61 protein [Algoriphagus sp.]